MALLSLGESKWRMVRRVLKKKRFTFDDCRNQTRHNQRHLDWLVENKFFEAAGDDRFEVTEEGRAAADLGFYEA
jgi:hypothetical protein